MATVFQAITFWCFFLALGLFSCAPRATMWESPSLLAPDPKDTGESFSPVGINDVGHVWLVWVQVQDHKRIFARSRLAGQRWGPAVPIDSGAEDALSPMLTIDPAGNASVFWTGWDGRRSRHYVSRYKEGSGWTTAAAVEIAETSVLQGVHIDGSGNVLLFWDRSDANGTGRVRLIRAMTGEEIDMELPALPRHMLGLQFEASEDGTAMAVWYQLDDTEAGTKYHVWTTSYRPADGWGTPRIVSQKEEDAIDPRLAAARNGDATIIWRQFDGEFYGIFASRFDPRIGWGQPTRISMAAGDDAVYPDLAMDARGNAFVVWVQRKCVRRRCEYSNAWAKQFQPGFGWGGTVRMADGGGSAQVTVDGQGSALVVGSRATGRLFKKSEIWARKYSMSKGWSELMRVESNWANTGHPQLSMNSQGEAIVSWEQYFLGHRTIWATQYHPRGE